MDYYINPTALIEGAFTVPVSIVDRYFKFSKPESIKVLLFILRNMADIPDERFIAENCSVSVYDVKEALLYWADVGILVPKASGASATEKKEAAAVIKNEKPTRQDVLNRSLEDPKIKYLLNEAQKKFARNLKDNETRTLVWLYDDQGLEVSVILLLLQYAEAKGKKNIRFIESVAADLVNKGIFDIVAADEELHRKDLGEKAWATVCGIFGLERRKPSQKETDAAVKWLDEWQLSKEMIFAAYEECVNKKSKFSFPYVAKILENWHSEGYKTTEDIENGSNKAQQSFASYDIDLYEKMINAKD